MKEVTVYTDGACSGNPGPGGWGAVLCYKGTEKELSGGEAVAGAYHPALGELVRFRLWRDKAEAMLSGVEPGEEVVLGVARSRISVMTGQHRANVSYLQERFALRSVRICAADVPDGEIVRI